MRFQFSVIPFLAAALLLSQASVSAAGSTSLTAAEALKSMKEGNARYLQGVVKYPKNDPVRRARTAAEGQSPIATVLGCADARVPVETAFDKAFGELFVIRVAGNVCYMAELASVEYGVNYLKTPLVVVLGHSQCGAVDAAVSGAALIGSLPKLMDEIKPAVDRAKTKHPDFKGTKLLDAAIEQNVWKSIEDLIKGSPTVAKAAKERRILIVGAVRDIKSGKVTWLGQHPDETVLLGTSK